ncbi:hypothetical protein RLOC_00000560 [Lonchura striata]|uniref:Uncharacterized protein n=2 Tax=Lonchura striata TaxID=40157 RepID=A0A218UD69_9PASE|nr:hypothetical protein RLOC_00000560 [Lonchura striata domestica]
MLYRLFETICRTEACRSPSTVNFHPLPWRLTSDLRRALRPLYSARQRSRARPRPCPPFGLLVNTGVFFPAPAPVANGPVWICSLPLRSPDPRSRKANLGSQPRRYKMMWT